MMRLSAIAMWTHGHLHGADASVTGVAIDSRKVQPGDLFVAFKGERVDGHAYLADAKARGAVAALVEHRVESDLPQVEVQSSELALGDLASAVRAQRNARVIGITGSNGKTTTKNLLRAVLEQVGPTIAPRASFNNEVGAPVTMLQVTEETQFLVAEMGASGIGEIARLVRMARPDVGVVLKVGLAHAGEFGGIEKTLQAKTEMVTDLLESDVAVLNIDDPRVATMADKTAARVLWFGLDERAAVRATDVVSSSRGTSFTLHLPDGQSRPVHFKVLGEHHVMNALAAAA
ncbi:MAG: UDP-N-acetylmuramoyl-tripeptide--D-alanyl-D-alanine ligase, partial [Dyella sp.]|uniref:UDP-N-acetylmuramoyl-tripeptide--D-alanyl-D- alanine ligase n=1 Tax=Dyella sp. TaxID=1869338 RepID=UPI003F7FF025